jgi:prepilin-type processing-associated H-X9-DG protein
MMYAQDYDESMPMLESGGAQRLTVANLLDPYIKTSKKNVNPLGGNLWPEDSIWRCPSGTTYNSGNLNSYFTVAYNFLYLTAVDLAPTFLPDWGAWDSNPNRRGIWAWISPGRGMAAVAQPAETVLFADAGHSDGPKGTKATWSGLLPPAARVANNAQDWFGVPEARHNEVATVAWCDGHVKPMRLEAFYGRWEGKTFQPTQTPPDRYFDLQ